MVDLQENNLPDALHEWHSRRAGELTLQEWQEHLAQRPKTNLGVEAAVLLQEARTRRDREIG